MNSNPTCHLEFQHYISTIRVDHCMVETVNEQQKTYFYQNKIEFHSTNQQQQHRFQQSLRMLTEFAIQQHPAVYNRFPH